jgi:hypothetical protein
MPTTEDDVRRLALALPEAEEHDHHGRPSFRVRNRIFATLREPGRANLKLPLDELTALVAERPQVFRDVVWGRDHRAGVDLAAIDAGELAELIETAWAEVAPKTLVRERFG